MHTVPVVPVLLSISLVLLAAKAGAFLAHKFKQPAVIGELLAKRAMDKKISKVYFDRGGYKYHGRVKALADSLRKNGLSF